MLVSGRLEIEAVIVVLSMVFRAGVPDYGVKRQTLIEHVQSVRIITFCWYPDLRKLDGIQIPGKDRGCLKIPAENPGDTGKNPRSQKEHLCGF
jgi:hypothetical protein